MFALGSVGFVWLTAFSFVVFGFFLQSQEEIFLFYYAFFIIVRISIRKVKCQPFLHWRSL